MISARLRLVHDVLLLGPVRGLSTEAPRVAEELEGFAPAAIGLGVSAEELKGLTDYFVVADGEPVVPLTSNELNEVRGLTRFGEVQVPNPSFVEAIRWGRDRTVPVAALDPSEEGSAELFAEHIGYVELVRRTVRERRVGRALPTPATPDEFAIQWERRVSSGRGSRRLAQARNEYLGQQATALARGAGSVAVVVDRERFDGIRSLLAAAGAAR